MKPLMMVLGLAVLMAVLGWTWSELPRPAEMFLPTWTRSYQLYKQPHAIWLSDYDRVGTNIPLLTRTLKAAAKAHQVPELVVYAIPLRDLGQSSDGGFATYEDYLADNRLNADLIQKFVKATGISPIVYLEPDSIPLAVQYRQDQHDSAEAWKIYRERVRTIKMLISLYQGAGAQVYLEAAHSDWFDYADDNIRRIATALNEAGIGSADGVATNISNRQPVTGGERNEFHYLSRLLPMLDKQTLDVRVDTSRNGGTTRARQYYLAADGRLIDNEIRTGRWIGRWHQDPQGTVWLQSFFGPAKSMTRLLAREKYAFDAEKNILKAPVWLDAVGDVKLGPAPTDTPPKAVASVIRHFRYIKPPDDCDGAVGCPPGMSKHDINEDIANRQPELPIVPPDVWASSP
jgi:hypothetical protein